MNPIITVQVTVNAPVDKVWETWTNPVHIIHWNHASDDWHSPKATNDLRAGGKFSYTMAAKDGSVSFNFEGIYDSVKPNERIAYTLGDARTVKIEFSENNGTTQIVEAFEMETENTEELQRFGWQAILNNFKNYCESIP
jgi:uncharacterized protein YndB with AHSA1/START domain